MKTFIEYFNIILTGDRDASRLAAREVRKLLYSSQGGNDKYKEIKDLVNNAPDEYAKISEEWRQENFVMAISVIYFLHSRENQPDFLFPWLFQMLLHKNGYIRHAAVRMIEHEIGPLTAHIRFPNEKFSSVREFTSKQSDLILFEMFMNLMNLIKYLWKSSYKKYKYVSLLPSGPYKSVQMVLGRLKEDCGKDCIARMKDDFRKYSIMSTAPLPRFRSEA